MRLLLPSLLLLIRLLLLPLPLTAVKNPHQFAADDDPLLANFDESIMEQLFHLSGCAYNHRTLGRCVRKIGWSLGDHVEVPCDQKGHNCGAFLAFSDKQRRIAFVFRGTESWRQLMEELRIGVSVDQQREMGNGLGKAHVYFMDALQDNKWPVKKKKGRRSGKKRQSLWESVLGEFDKTVAKGGKAKNRRKDYQLLFTGHSLGGALAALAALKWAIEREKVFGGAVKKGGWAEQQKGARRVWEPEWLDLAGKQLSRASKIQLYTFGQPRVGSPLLAQWMDKILPVSFRIVNGMDIVAHMPPCSPSFRCSPDLNTALRQDMFRHHGIEIWYLKGNHGHRRRYKVCASESPECSRTVMSAQYIEAIRQESVKYWQDLRNGMQLAINGFGKLLFPSSSSSTTAAGGGLKDLHGVLGKTLFPALKTVPAFKDGINWLSKTAQSAGLHIGEWVGSAFVLWQFADDHLYYLGKRVSAIGETPEMVRKGHKEL